MKFLTYILLMYTRVLPGSEKSLPVWQKLNQGFMFTSNSILAMDKKLTVYNGYLDFLMVQCQIVLLL